jgi:hypothetical protein
VHLRSRMGDQSSTRETSTTLSGLTTLCVQEAPVTETAQAVSTWETCTPFRASTSSIHATDVQGTTGHATSSQIWATQLHVYPYRPVPLRRGTAPWPVLQTFLHTACQAPCTPGLRSALQFAAADARQQRHTSDLARSCSAHPEHGVQIPVTGVIQTLRGGAWKTYVAPPKTGTSAALTEIRPPSTSDTAATIVREGLRLLKERHLTPKQRRRALAAQTTCRQPASPPTCSTSEIGLCNKPSPEVSVPTVERDLHACSPADGGQNIPEMVRIQRHLLDDDVPENSTDVDTWTIGHIITESINPITT